MKLMFSSCLSVGYFQSLIISRDEQPKMWEGFCENVPTFSVVSSSKCQLIVQGIATHYKYKNLINESKHLYETIWTRLNTRIKNDLDNIFGYELKLQIVANVCITPLFIRNIQRRFFLVPTNSTERRICEIIIHELSHFYFYYHPDVIHTKYDSHKVWLLSEYLVPHILRNFSDLCDVSKSYLPPCPSECDTMIRAWINRRCTLGRLLQLFVENVGD